MEQALIDTFQYLVLKTIYGDTPDLEELIATNSAASFFLLLLIIKVIKRCLVPLTYPHRDIADHIEQVTRSQLDHIPAEQRQQDLEFFIQNGPHPPTFDSILAIVSDWFTSES